VPGHHGSAVIEVYSDPESMNQAAAALVVKQANLAVAARGRFCIAVSGGRTPRRTYELLTQPPFSDQAPWDRMHIFWGDERCVPLDDPRSNARMAREAWLDHVPIPRDQIHPLDCVRAPAAAARHYEARLREFFAHGPPRLDLVLLGLGEDGHTASLFPGAPALAERARWAVEVYTAGQDLLRITLTAPLINRARVVAFLVTGRGKARVLGDVLHGPRDPMRLPAQLIQPENGELLWLIDTEAATQLPT
jgi:6-phosphogluconolactonase